MELYIRLPSNLTCSLIVDMTRTGKIGNVKVILSRISAVKYVMTDMLLVNNIPFRHFYEFILTNWHNSDYHRYTRNCFDFVEAALVYLVPNVSHIETRKIHVKKCEIVSQFWE